MPSTRRATFYEQPIDSGAEIASGRTESRIHSPFWLDVSGTNPESSPVGHQQQPAIIGGQAGANIEIVGHMEHPAYSELFSPPMAASRHAFVVVISPEQSTSISSSPSQVLDEVMAYRPSRIRPRQPLLALVTEQRQRVPRFHLLVDDDADT